MARNAGLKLCLHRTEVANERGRASAKFKSCRLAWGKLADAIGPPLGYAKGNWAGVAKPDVKGSLLLTAQHKLAAWLN